MKLSNLLRINAILYVISGIAFALYGPLMLAFFGILESEGSADLYWYAVSFGRMFGAALFGFGFLIWAVSQNINQSASIDFKRKIVLGLILGHLTALVVALTQQASIWGMSAGWITVGILLALLAGYVLILVKNSWD